MHITFLTAAALPCPGNVGNENPVLFLSSIIRSCPEFKRLLFLVIEPRPDSTAPDCPRLPSSDVPVVLVAPTPPQASFMPVYNFTSRSSNPGNAL
jgi:hypothetical protein